MSPASRYAVIVAGGRGERMSSRLPKQFMAMAGKPIILHTLEAFTNLHQPPEILLVLPENEIPAWQEIQKEYGFNHPVKLVHGGNNRTESVKNGIMELPVADGTVAIHDGVRPFPASTLLNDAFKTAEEKGTAIPGIPLKDSLRELTFNHQSKAVNRENFRLIQTPQTFSIPIIQDAFKIFPETSFPDEASLVEAAGFSVELIEGAPENIKITYPEDIVYGEALLNNLFNS